MTYASDKLYNEFIKKMMSQLATVVKVREIVPHLPCLTLTDREEIEAKRETVGNYNAMIMLLDCLRRRENWPEEFISALRACEHFSLADNISDIYDTIRGINPQRTAPVSAPPPPPPAPPAPPAAVFHPSPVHVPTAAAAPVPATASATTITTATIHTPHSNPPLLTPSSVEDPAQAALPAHIHNPPESLHTRSAPNDELASISAPEALVPPPPEQVQPSEPSGPVSVPHARLPFPITAPNVTASSKQKEVSLNPRATSNLNSSDGLTLSADSHPPSAIATTLPSNMTTASPTQPNIPCTTPEESKIPLAVTETSSSMKSPVQDTSPPEINADLNQESNISTTTSQLVERMPTAISQTSVAQTASPETAQVSPSAFNDAVTGHLSHTAAAEEEYFSKPGTLMGTEPSIDGSDDLQISRPPMESTRSAQVEPARPAPLSSHQQPEEHSEDLCSVTSNELMFSVPTASNASSSQTHRSQNPHLTAPENLITHSTPEENSFHEGDPPFFHNQPVEDHFESNSLEEEPGTLVNVFHVSEEPSILNFSGYPPSMIGNAGQTNEHPVSFNCTSQTESSVRSEDQPCLHSQGNPECTPDEQHVPVADVLACAQPPPLTCQEIRVNASGLFNTPQSQQRDNAQESQGVLQHLHTDPRIIAGAAAIAVAAVFIAWKLKH